jgi:hypothetical protein
MDAIFTIYPHQAPYPYRRLQIKSPTRYMHLCIKSIIQTTTTPQVPSPRPSLPYNTLVSILTISGPRNIKHHSQQSFIHTLPQGKPVPDARTPSPEIIPIPCNPTQTHTHTSKTTDTPGPPSGCWPVSLDLPPKKEGKEKEKVPAEQQGNKRRTNVSH